MLDAMSDNFLASSVSLVIEHQLDLKGDTLKKTEGKVRMANYVPVCYTALSADGSKITSSET